jgi:hypothetical protein
VHLKEVIFCDILPADKVADYVGMTDKHIIRILVLSDFSAMEMLAECSLNSCTIFIELLRANTPQLKTQIQHKNMYNSIPNRCICLRNTQNKEFYH